MVPPEDSRAVRRTARAAQKAKTYQAFSLFFAYPDPAVSELLRACVTGTGSRTVSTLYSTYTTIPRSTLEAEYLRLFHTSGTLPPYESASLERTGRSGTVLADVSGFYRAWGLRTSQKNPDMPDSISAELEFAAFLLLKVLYAESKGWMARAKQAAAAYRIFVREHPAAWIPQFCRSVRENTLLDFYRRLAAAIQRFFLREMRALASRGSVKKEGTSIRQRQKGGERL